LDDPLADKQAASESVQLPHRQLAAGRPLPQQIQEANVTAGGSADRVLPSDEAPHAAAAAASVSAADFGGEPDELLANADATRQHPARDQPQADQPATNDASAAAGADSLLTPEEQQQELRQDAESEAALAATAGMEAVCKAISASVASASGLPSTRVDCIKVCAL